MPDKIALTANFRDPIQSTLRRFVSKDPKGFIAGANVYVYCENNPVRFIDPTGLQMGGPEIETLYNPQAAPEWSNPEFVASYSHQSVENMKCACKVGAEIAFIDFVVVKGLTRAIQLMRYGRALNFTTYGELKGFQKFVTWLADTTTPAVRGTTAYVLGHGGADLAAHLPQITAFANRMKKYRVTRLLLVSCYASWANLPEITEIVAKTGLDVTAAEEKVWNFFGHIYTEGKWVKFPK